VPPATRSKARAGLLLGGASLIVGVVTVSVAALPASPTGAASAPVVTCTSNENIFNTGFNVKTGGVLANGSKDANWQVAGPFDTPNGTTPPSAVSLPPTTASFVAANVGNLRPVAWSKSPYGNAQWISQQTLAHPKQPNENGDWYYEYQFTLDPSVDPSTFSLDMNFLADNDVAEVFVNGVAQSSQTTGLPQAPPTADPYHYAGYTAANAAATTLNHDWQTGSNTIIIEDKSGYPYEGFDAQMRPSAICPIDLAVTKTASPNPYTPGHALTYTVTVTNGGPGDAVGVTIADPLPSALAGAGFTWTCTATAGSTCSASGSGNITDTVNIAAGGTLTYTVTGTVPAAASTSLTNTVTVTPPSGTTDPGCTPNCTATNVDPPVSQTTVSTSLSESASAKTVNSGTSVTFTYNEKNTGTVPITSVTVTGSSCGPATFVTSSDSNTTTLDTGATWTFTCTETLTNTGTTTITVTDSATATGMANGTAAPPETASASVKVKPGPPSTCGIGVTISPNPLVETGESEVHAVIQVSDCSQYAGDTVSISSSQLASSCGSGINFVSLQPGAKPGSGWIDVVLDDDGNATVIVNGTACAAGSSLVEASLTEAPFSTATTTLQVTPPAVTTPGVVGYPANEVETGNTTASGDSDVYAVFYVETDPVYAEQTVEISSPELFDRCAGTIAPTWTSNMGVFGTQPATATIDNDGNAVFVFTGSSCAAGTSTVTADVLAGTHGTYSSTYTILAPTPTI
jgi:uncharacterized repeat protein (TIGR01451 family)